LLLASFCLIAVGAYSIEPEARLLGEFKKANPVLFATDNLNDFQTEYVSLKEETQTLS
jgi:hypothetical protein